MNKLRIFGAIILGLACLSTGYWILLLIQRVGTLMLTRLGGI